MGSDQLALCSTLAVAAFSLLGHITRSNWHMTFLLSTAVRRAPRDEPVLLIPISLASPRWDINVIRLKGNYDNPKFFLE